jgi:ribosomal protein S18 acetylase RimI-like enzyme
MIKKRRWRPLSKKTMTLLTDFLKEQEPYCVAACARILHHAGSQNKIWMLHNTRGSIDAMLLHFHRSFFPVFRGEQDIPIPYFLPYLLLTNPIHAVQGLASDADILERAIGQTAGLPRERRDYHLMQREGAPGMNVFAGGPPSLAIRRPVPEDADEIFALQAGYEKEEVLPQGSDLDPAKCRLLTEQMIKNEFSLIAVLDGRTVGKINVGAQSFNYCQIGGVYVLPQYRGRGIAQRLGSAFVRGILAKEKKLSLYVKKKNAAAKRVYENLGFTVIGDYRISYY